MSWAWVIPKKFLCYYSLVVGAYTTGIAMICIHGLCAIILLAYLLTIFEYSVRKDHRWLNVFGITVVAFLDCLIMLAINCCYLFAVNKKKSQVIMIWLALMALWLMHTFVLVIIIIIHQIIVSNVTEWTICLVAFLIGFGMVMYGYLCAFGYWLRLRRFKTNSSSVTTTT